MTTFWLNGELVAEGEANISLLDHGLLYGDGVFEGIRFYNRRPFLAEKHLQRLFESATALELSITYSAEFLHLGINDVIKAFDHDQGYIRLVVTRGVGKLGIDPRHCSPNVFMIADQLQVHTTNTKSGIHAICASIRRVGLQSWDQRIKSLNYLNNILAKIEANHARADEALLLNQQGYIAEGSVSNLFVVKNNTLFTPPTWDGALAGVTRNTLLNLAQDLGLQQQQHSLTPFDVYTADESFLCGTGFELMPLASLDGRNIKHCPGPVFTKLYETFRNFIHSETKAVSK